MHAWADVAVLAKARNTKGGFVAHSVANLPFLLSEGLDVAFVPPQTNMPRSARVSRVSLTGERTAIVEFEGIDDPETARGLVGSHCLVRRSDVGLWEGDDDAASWEGWSVVDVAHGELGRISGVIDNGAQSLLEVSRTDGDEHPLLIPLVDEFIDDVDASAKCVTVAIPDGLLDL